VTDHRRELYYGLIRIHVLLHAAEEPIFGMEMMTELAHHGYCIGPGTLYPMLHGMERAGLLKSTMDTATGRRRRIYRITAAGRRAFSQAREKVDELHRELHEAHPRLRRELPRGGGGPKMQTRARKNSFAEKVTVSRR
jgi:PadR family transcriptional regulator PadR